MHITGCLQFIQARRIEQRARGQLQVTLAQIGGALKQDRVLANRLDPIAVQVQRQRRAQIAHSRAQSRFHA